MRHGVHHIADWLSLAAALSVALGSVLHAAQAGEVPFNSAEFKVGALLYEDAFDHGIGQWSAEIERPSSLNPGSLKPGSLKPGLIEPGSVKVVDGVLRVDVPAGATVWFKHPLEGAVLIEYEATVIQAGGANDRLSDLNCFWMATDTRSPADLFATLRSGQSAEYNRLKTYYVGQGGNGNTTTRFRRYIGSQDSRPLLPEHDFSAAAVLLKANVAQTIQLVAAGDRVQYLRNGSLIFDVHDPDPYTSGYYAFRTTHSHIELRRFRVYRLSKKP